MARFLQYSFRQIYGNPSARIMLFVFLGISTMMFSLVYFSYQSHLDAGIERELSALRVTVKSLALRIDGRAHDQLMRSHLDQDAISSNEEVPQYSHIHETLLETKEILGIETDIYTAVKDRNEQFYFAVSTSDQPYFRHKWAYPNESHYLLYTQGGEVQPYTTKTGTWLSAFMPIKVDGGTIAIVQADKQFDAFIAEARSAFVSDLLIYGLIFLIASVLLLRIIDRVMAKQEKLQSRFLAQAELVEQRNRDIVDSIMVAKRLQDAVLPCEEGLRQYIPDLGILYEPKDIVSGDFYWSEQVGSRTYLAVGDCTGHGIPGAFMSMMAASALYYVLNKQQDDLGLMLKELDHIISKHIGGTEANTEGMDIALCCIDSDTAEVRYAGALRPLIYFKEQTLHKIHGDRRGIGGEVTDFLYTEHTLDAAPGDVIYMFSDGYSDQFGGQAGRKYMTKRFRDFLTAIQDHPLEEQIYLLRYEFHLWKEQHEQVDDVLVIGFRVPEPRLQMIA